ncbi:MAG: MFS transporter [Planctomycetota bacterium]|nr:MFS transporter [Planctomycetota bacterium]MDA1162290.1 MFS transporter [Planctomycetota bacterium]
MSPCPENNPASATGLAPERGVYGRIFWLCYAGNLLMVAANALTFRFADLVRFLGGTETTTGEIVQVGMLGALCSRIFLGRALDRYGTRMVWCLSTLMFITSCVAFAVCREISWTIFAARVAFAAGVAGMSTAAILHVQNQVPRARRTEVIGNFGSSGFVGMVVGSQLGDLIFALTGEDHSRFYILFGLTALLTVAHGVLALMITRGDTHVRPGETPWPHRLVVRYWPGPIVAVAIMMGVSLTVTTVFLSRMTAERGLSGIGTFFLGYCGSAFIFRVASSTWASRFGRHQLLLFGLLGHAAGHLMLSQVTAQWQLLVPALTCGFGHALLFPSVVSLGAGTFPREYRGTGTSIILGFTEVGVAVSAPVLGWIIDTCRASGVVDPFAAMYYTSAASACCVAVYYALATRSLVDELLTPVSLTTTTNDAD